MRSPRTRASLFWSAWRSFWLLPAACTVGAAVLAVGLPLTQLHLELPFNGIVPSGAPAARSLLSSIVTAMISLTALVFSITIVVLQLASSQYSPRVMRTYLEDRSTQFTLGVFVATFVYSMILLSEISDQPGGGPPQIALMVAILLVIGSAAVFIFYIQHITRTLRVSHIIASIGAQTRHLIDRYHPTDAPAETPSAPGLVARVMTAPDPGIVTDVDLDRLARLARSRRCRLVVVVQPGDYVAAGQPLVTVHRDGDGEPGRIEESDVARVVTIGPERVAGQDVEFGFRQLADIAERSLSTAMNDVTTALRAVDELHDLLRRVATRPLGDGVVHDSDGTVRAIARRAGFDRFAAAGVDDVAYAGRDQPRVRRRLARMLDDLAGVAAPVHRAAIRRRRDALGDLGGNSLS